MEATMDDDQLEVLWMRAEVARQTYLETIRAMFPYKVGDEFNTGEGVMLIERLEPDLHGRIEIQGRYQTKNKKDWVKGRSTHWHKIHDTPRPAYHAHETRMAIDDRGLAARVRQGLDR
jgi:hypothetical protein